MSSSDSDPRLSAYLDDEVTSEERAAVEARLAESLDAQKVLDEYRELSRDLQQLPRHAAPPELIQGVKAGIASGAASPTAQAPPVTRPAAPAQSPRHHWRRSTLGLAMTALVLFLAIPLLWNNSVQVGREATDIAATEESTASSLALAPQTAELLAATDVETLSRNTVWLRDTGGLGSMDVEPPPAEQTDAQVGVATELFGAHLAGRSDNELAEGLGSGRLQIGAVKTLTEQRDGELVVVEVTVVDVKKMADQLQVLLARNGIPQQAEPSDSDEALPPGTTDGKLFALYAQGPQESLLAAMDQWTSTADLITMSVSEQVEIPEDATRYVFENAKEPQATAMGQVGRRQTAAEEAEAGEGAGAEVDAARPVQDFAAAADQPASEPASVAQRGLLVTGDIAAPVQASEEGMSLGPSEVGEPLVTNLARGYVLSEPVQEEQTSRGIAIYQKPLRIAAVPTFRYYENRRAEGVAQSRGDGDAQRRASRSAQGASAEKLTEGPQPLQFSPGDAVKDVPSVAADEGQSDSAGSVAGSPRPAALPAPSAPEQLFPALEGAPAEQSLPGRPEIRVLFVLQPKS